MAMSLEGKTVDSYHTWGLDRLNFAENAQVFQSFDFEIFLDHYILKQANTKFKTRFDHHQLNFKLGRIQNIAEHFYWERKLMFSASKMRWEAQRLWLTVATRAESSFYSSTVEMGYTGIRYIHVYTQIICGINLWQ